MRFCSGSKMIEDKIEQTETPMKLSDQERRVFEVVYTTTSSVTHMAAGFVDMALSSAISGINSVVYKNENLQARDPVQNASRHIGISALQAAVKIVGGVASAASVVLGSSRDSIIQVVHKKFGEDAGYIAQRTIGVGSNMAETLVYFDARGISRRVVLSGAIAVSNNVKEGEGKKGSHEVVFENDWLEEQYYQTKPSENLNSL